MEYRKNTLANFESLINLGFAPRTLVFRMATKFIELMKYCRTPFELNAKPGDKILIVTDTSQEELVWQALAAAGTEKDCEVTVGMMPPRIRHHAEPTAPIAEAMKKADINLLATTKAMGATQASGNALKAGASRILMEEVSVSNLTTGGATLTVDEYRAMFQFGQEIRRAWEAGNKVHVTSELGTDLRCEIRDPKTGKVKTHNVAGILEERPGNCAFPDGECGTTPIAGTGEGTIVWDTTVHYPRGLLKEPIKITVRKGRVVGIDGGVEAKQFEEYVKTYGDHTSYECPSEIAIGMNPLAAPTGVVRTDKKLLGGVHIAMGYYYAGPLHLDGIIRYPTITVDDKVLVEKGKINIGKGRF